MKERLDSILRYYKLNSSRLAEMIDVQRSGISHILSGRNNPSYDFLVRILNTFPDINANWLLTGVGNMINGEDESTIISENNTNVFSPAEPVEQDNRASKPNYKNELQMSTDQSVYKSKQIDSSLRIVEKVIILYSDGKFKEYDHE